jgi:3-deoxy-D-manno-octulosonate 8-phosphate phosphatase (KDO 8-P phosphatase)
MAATLPRAAPGIWTPELTARAGALEWLLLDVDGVLTDGRLWFDSQGEVVKVFDVRDGLGVKLLTGAGIAVGILSARTSPIVEKRSRDLGLTEVLQGRENKLEAFRDFLARHRLEARQVAYLADDLLDLAVLGVCGFSAAPADAVPDVRHRVNYVTAARGGRGAVRELAERLLTARGVWESLVERFATPPESADPSLPADASSAKEAADS